MYIAVILENFNQAQEDVQQVNNKWKEYKYLKKTISLGFNQWWLWYVLWKMYYEKWQRFDPSGSQFIQYDQLSDFVNDLELPLRIPKRNHLKLVRMNLPICENDRMHCVDILDALTK